MMSMITIVSYLLIMVFVLVAVAFVTLLERKILGYIQIRKGPNKVGYKGYLQPFADAVKLFTKEQGALGFVNFIPYYFSPIFALFVALLIWSVLPYDMGLISFKMGVLFFLCCMSISVYSVIGAGWSSNSKYSLLGCVRAVAQTISYEVSLALVLLSLLLLVGGVDFSLFIDFQRYISFLFLTFPLALVWFASCLAETNRTPFDFSEGESELVSGFNVEYGAGGFALIFMAEYASILFMSVLLSVLFLGANLMSSSFYLKVAFVVFCFMWIRGTLPRLRYDKLMYLCWKSFLPVSLNYLLFFSGLKVIISLY